jgi:hypothetical protein
MWFCKGSWTSGFTCLIERDGWTCFSVYSVPNRRVIDEMTTRNSFPITNHNEHFFLKTATAKIQIRKIMWLKK